MRITQFENEEYVINTYLEKHRLANMVYGVIRLRLLAVYGIGVLEHLRNLKAEEVIELLVYAEYTTESIGQFAETLGRKDLFPRDRKGKIKRDQFLKMLFGNEFKEQLGEDQPGEQMSRAPREPKTFDDLQNMMDRSVKARKMTSSDMELENTDAGTYAKLKKEGKIKGFKKELDESIGDARSALLEQIEQDRQRYGNRGSNKSGGYRGSIQDLLDSK